MADVRTVNFLRLQIPAPVLLNVKGTRVFKSLFDLSCPGMFFPQNVVPNRWICGALRIFTAVQ